MAGSQSPAGKPEKTMSSNLLTMKFMRRAAASKESQSPISSASSHATKRPRLSTEADSPRTSDMEAISAALAAEEEKRQQAVARAAEEAGETHWVLDFPAAAQSTPQPMVLAADSLDADEDSSAGGRRAYGNFKRKERKTQSTPSKGGSEDDEDGSEDEDRIVNPANPEQVAKMLEQEQARHDAKARRNMNPQPKLSQLTSISGSGRAPMMGAPSSDKKKKKKRKSY